MKSPIKAVPAGGRLNLFFMEMIIVLMFFSIASAVILNAFAVSGRLSRESERLERMSFCAQSAAEIFSESGSLSQTLEELFGSGSYEILNLDLEGGGYAAEAKLPLTGDCEYFPQSPEIFMILAETAEKSDSGTLKILSVKFENTDNEELYRITSGAYIPAERRSDANE